MEQRSKRPKGQEFLPAVRRAPYGKLTIYEISEDELDQLHRGSPDALILNLSVFCCTTFISFLITLFTVPLVSRRVFDVFVIVTVVSGLAGAILFLVWLKTRRTTSALIRTIRGRLPPEEGLQEAPPSGGGSAEAE